MANRFSIQPASGLGGFQALSAGIAKRGEFELQKLRRLKTYKKDKRELRYSNLAISTGYKLLCLKIQL